MMKYIIVGASLTLVAYGLSLLGGDFVYCFAGVWMGYLVGVIAE